ncbi:MAG: alpha/beta hydrolase [Granulosicoccus sp.]
MIEQAIVDWDNAYENGGHIVGGGQYPAHWQNLSEQFRQECPGEFDVSYGSGLRERYDLFVPDPGKFENAHGLFVFIHGGYWQRTDKSFWSFLARGALDAGWSVAIPSYVLCPDASIAMIQKMVANCINQVAERVDGPIILSGHSAGGQLVQAMMCENSTLSASVVQRLSHVLSISGLADLRPLLKTKLNDALRLDTQSASAGSPVLQQPITHVPLTAWVGAGERAEFIRQNALIANMWRGLGVCTRVVEEPDRHHFDVIEGLCDSQSPMMRAILP